MTSRAAEVLRWLAAPLRLRSRSLLWLLVYLASCAAILGVVAWWIVRHERDFVGWLSGYVARSSWKGAAQMILEQLLAAQQKEILVNAVLTASLALVSLLLFPVKEKLSATFEREARLTPHEGRGFPLLFEASEEIKLFVAFLAVQSSIFWLGYPPDPTRRAIALVLSYLVLAASFAMDFVTPILQRHEVRFSTAAKTLAKHPLSTLLFGMTFGAPPALAGGLIAHNAEWGLGRTMAVIFAVNVVAIAWAALSGTVLGARLLPAAQATRRPTPVTRGAVFALLVVLLAWNGYRFTAVAIAVHKKSAILKCEYDVDWSSVRLDKSDLLGALAGLARDEVEVGLTLDVTITNPTARPVEMEQNRLELQAAGKVAARSALPVFKVPPGGRTVVPANFRVALTPSALARSDLLDKSGWKLVLYIQAAPGFELPVYVF